MPKTARMEIGLKAVASCGWCYWKHILFLRLTKTSEREDLHL